MNLTRFFICLSSSNKTYLSTNYLYARTAAIAAAINSGVGGVEVAAGGSLSLSGNFSTSELALAGGALIVVGICSAVHIVNDPPCSPFTALAADDVCLRPPRRWHRRTRRRC